MIYAVSALIAALLAAGPAQAEPITIALFSAVGIGLTAGTFTTAAITFALGTAVSLGLSYLSRALLAPKPQVGEVLTGLETQVQIGGDIPRQIVIGYTSVKGQLVYHNTNGPNNELYQRVYVLSDSFVDSINGVVINGRAYPLNITSEDTTQATYTITEFGTALTLHLLKGNQTSADGTLMTYANPAGKWDSNSRLTHVAYVACYFTYVKDSPLYENGIPELSFHLKGSRLYDWRYDSTAGGVGPQRWGDQHTWAYTDNPIVALYNFRRGFYANGELILGMGMPASHMLQDIYTAAANACDEVVTLDAGGTERRYRCSTILTADQGVTWGQSIDVLLSTCAGYLYDYSGFDYPVVGVAQASVATITDDDLRIGSPIIFAKKRTRDSLVNRVHGQFIDDTQNFEPKSYTARISSAGVTADGEERGVALDLLSVPSQFQAERIAEIRLRESRAQGTAQVTVGYEWIRLQAGDWITWNSALYGNRVWRIVSRTRDATSRAISLELAEINSSVFSWGTSDEGDRAPVPVRLQTGIQIASVAAFQIHAAALPGSGASEVPALRFTWTPIVDPSVDSVIVEYRQVGTTPATRVSDPSPGDGEHITSAGVSGGIDYEARATISTTPPRPTSWTSWVSITTSDFIFDLPTVDLPEIYDLIDAEVPLGAPTLSNAGITSELIRQPDGTIVTKVVADWPDITGAYEYIVEFQEGTGNFINFTTKNSRYEWIGRVPPGATVHIKVSAVTQLGTQSSYSTVDAFNGTHVVAANPVGPSASTSLTLQPTFRGFNIIFNLPPESDYAYTIIYESPTSAFGAVDYAATVRTNTYARAGLEAGVTKWYWVQHVNTSGIGGAVYPLTTDPGVTGTTQLLSTRAEFAENITPVETFATLPTTGNFVGRKVSLSTDDYKLYRYTGTGSYSGWSKSSDVADLTGQLLAEQMNVPGAGTNVAFNNGFEALDASGFPVGVALGFSWTGGIGQGFTPNGPGAWKPLGMFGLEVYSGPSAPAGSYSDLVFHTLAKDGTNQRYPVTAGKRYEVSLYVSPWESNVQLFIEWWNAAGAIISYTGHSNVVTAPVNSPNQPLSLWPRCVGFGTAPAGAATMRLYCRSTYTGGATNDYYLEAAGLYIGEAYPNQTVASPWTPTGQVITHGGTITAESIVGGSIKAGTITGTNIAATTVDTINLKASAVVADKIAAGEVTASKLTIGSNAQNLVVNGGFEDAVPGFLPRGWTLTALAGTAVSPTTYDVAGGVKEGKYSLIFDLGAGALASCYAYIRSKDFPVEEGETYECFAFVTTAGNGDTNGMYTRVNWLTAAGAVVSSTDIDDLSAPSSGWRKRQKSFTPPATAKQAFIELIYFGPAGATTRYCLIDGLVFRRAIGETGLEADAVTAGKIAAGAVVASKLAVGTSSNRAYNSDGRINEDGKLGWIEGGNSIAATNFVHRGGFDYGLPGMNMVQKFWAGNPGAGGEAHLGDILHVQPRHGALTAIFPVVPGQRYEWSSHLSCHRCQGYCQITWYNSAGTYLGEVNWAGGTAGWVVGQRNYAWSGSAANTAAEWEANGRAFVIATAPAGAAYATLSIRAFKISPNQADMYLIASGHYWGPAGPSQVVPSPWSNGVTTVIDGTGIMTGSIKTNSFEANSIDGTIITAGTLDATKITAGTTMSGTVIVSGQYLQDTVGRSLDPIARANIQGGNLNGSGVSLAGTAVATVVSNAATGALDPVTRINANTTTIDPGRVLIAGSTTLNDWRDLTEIKGGAIKTYSIRTDKLLLSDGSQNRVINSDMAGGIPSPYYLGGTNWGAPAAALLLGGNASAVPGSSVLYNEWGSVTAGGGYYADIYVGDVGADAVTTSFMTGIGAGAWYEASVSLAAHRCAGEIYIQWIDVLGNHIAYSGPAALDAAGKNGGDAAKMSTVGPGGGRVRLTAIAPAGTAQCRLLIRQTFEPDGVNNPYLFISGVYFGITPDPSYVTPYSTKSSTFIHGGLIQTNTVKANVLRANIIDSTHLRTDVAVITGTAQIADSVITTAKIGDAQITTAKIGYQQVGASNIGLAQIKTAHIDDAQISTAKIGDLQVVNAHIYNLTIGTGKVANFAISSQVFAVGDIASGNYVVTYKAVTAGTRLIVIVTVGCAYGSGVLSSSGTISFTTWSLNMGGVAQVIQYSPDTCIAVTYGGGSSYTFTRTVSPCTIVCEITSHSTTTYQFDCQNPSPTTCRMAIQVLELNK